jgi:TolB protein
MKKKFLHVILILLCSFLVLSACTGAPPTEEEIPPPQDEEPEEPAKEPLPQPTNTVPPPTPTTEPSPTPTTEPENPRVVFVSNRSGDEDSRFLHLMDLETDEITLLDTGMDNLAFPRWSPDGSKILFVVVDIWNLYTVEPDGSNLTQVTDFRSNNADWSPDGSQIVFQSDHANEPEDIPDIYTMNVDGSDLIKIVQNLDIPDFGPRWSRTGEFVSFISFMEGFPAAYAIPPEGGDIVRISGNDVFAFEAAISPDGRQFIFAVQDQAGNSDLYHFDTTAEEDGLLQLTDDAAVEASANWFPDGSKIVYHSRDGELYDLWMANVDGSEIIQLTDDPFIDLYPDVWVP